MTITNNPNFYRGVIGILFVVILMTIYEVTLYYTFVVPTFDQQIVNLASEMKPLVIDSIPGFEMLQNIIYGITLNNEEDTTYIKNLKVVIMSTLIFFLFFLLVLAFHKLNVLTKYEPFGRDISPYLMNGLFIFVVLLGFQIFMIFFSLKYNFGSENEISVRFVNSLLKARGEKEIELPSGISLTKNNS